MQESSREDPYVINKYGSDPRFYNYFQANFYSSALFEKNTRITNIQWVYWENRENIDDWDTNKVCVRERCEHHGIINLIDLKKEWSDDLISHFPSLQRI